jgi:hypothetical protein
LAELTHSGYAITGAVNTVDILSYLESLKGFIIALVDFAFIPDDRP